MGRTIESEDVIKIPSDVTVHVKARSITVKGPRGVLKKDLSHISLDICKLSNSKLKVVVWNGARKHVACIRTVCTLIENMIKGVTQGFRYKMRLVYAHFPINVVIGEGGRSVEIRNFLGEKKVRQINLLSGVTISSSSNVKDELVLEGNCVENVSQSAASIKNSCNVRNKDIRKFLDGIYVSERTVVDDSL